jgi:hypothetical protein
VVLFRHHDPLTFTAEQLADLLDASWLWFARSQQHYNSCQQRQQGQAARRPGRQQVQEDSAAAASGEAALWPFFLWNCLPRAGASQFHGHAQVSNGAGCGMGAAPPPN